MFPDGEGIYALTFLNRMKSLRRTLAIAAYAAFIPFPLTGLGPACEAHMEASMNMVNMVAPSADSREMVNGPMVVRATMSRMDDGDCAPPPCSERMPQGDCQAMPGCVAGASLGPATSRTAANRPATAGTHSAPMATLASRVIAPEVPPPRA